MSVTLTADSHTAMLNHINALGREVRELKEENEELKEEAEQNKQLFNTTFSEFMKLKEENEKLKKQVELYTEHSKKLEKDAELSREFWFCFMDCKDNPDNPTKEEIDYWCDDNEKSDEIREYITQFRSDPSDSDDEEEEKECGVDGFRCEDCCECNRTRVCDECECVGGCYEHCPYLTGKWNA